MMGGVSDGPWTGWTAQERADTIVTAVQRHWNTIEAEPDIERELRRQLESARRFAIAFEARLEEIRQVWDAKGHRPLIPGSCSCLGCALLTLLDSPLPEVS